MLPLEIHMQKMNARRHYDLEAHGLAERPMGARLPRSQHEVFEYAKALGMSTADARLFAISVGAAGYGVTQEALNEAHAIHAARVQEMERRRVAVEERAAAAAIRSPSTGNAIRSHERRASQKAAARKKRK
jgi:hypothetical protein